MIFSIIVYLRGGDVAIETYSDDVDTCKKFWGDQTAASAESVIIPTLDGGWTIVRTADIFYIDIQPNVEVTPRS